MLAAAGSIGAVEARHAAAIRVQRGESPAPTAFNGTLDRKAAMAALRPFLAG